MEETGEERIERRVDGRFKGEKKRFEEIWQIEEIEMDWNFMKYYVEWVG